MKNLFKLSSLLLAGLFVLTSCEPNNDDVEVATLQLSKNTLNFDKLGGEESVAITTNQTNWTYVSSLEGQWVNITKDGNNLKITALPNPEGKDRTGVILVTAGGASSRIEVAQIAADIVLDINPGELNFSAKGGEKRISVKSNNNAWEIAPVEEVDWLKFEKAGDIVFVTAQPNQGDPRLTKLLAKSGAKHVEIVVNQAAIEQLTLPLYLNNSADEIIRGEIARGGILLKYEEPTEYWGNKVDGVISILPNSSLFSSFTYTIPYENRKEWRKIIGVSDNWSELKSDEFKAFIVQNGFNPVENQQNNRRMNYINKECKVKLTVLQEGKDDKTTQGILMKRYIEQKKSYKSFSQLPKPLHQFLEKGKYEDVEKWMTENKYVVDKKVNSPANKSQVAYVIFVNSDPSGDNPDAIVCFFYADSNDEKVALEKVGVLQEYDVVYKNNLTRMMWNSIGDTWLMTNEYTEVLAKGGYSYYIFDDEGKSNYLYHDGNDNLALVNKANFKEIFDGQNIVRTAYWHDDVSSYSLFNLNKCVENNSRVQKAIDPFRP